MGTSTTARTVTLFVGTTKGLFVFTSDERRAAWDLRGPMLPGWEVGGICATDDGRWLIGTSHMAYGSTIRISDDHGETWEQMEHSPAFGEGSGLGMKRVWQIVPGSAPGALYAGTEAAGLFVSRDRGHSWQGVPGFNDHPTRHVWHTGTSCPFCVHTILTHAKSPQRMWAVVSSAGIFRTDDGGATWHPRNAGLPGAAIDGFPGPRSHVQKVAQDPASPDTLYVQHHNEGMYRTTDGGEAWHPLPDGLPTRFGFALASAGATGDVFTVPLDRKARFFPDGTVRVYRLRRGESQWHPLDRGLPTEPQFVGVLRDALDCDALPTPGVYFGTSEGQVFTSPDAGETWRPLPHRFSRVTTIRAHVSS